MAELADAPALGAGGRKAVGVRVPSSAEIFFPTQSNRSVHMIGRVDARERLPYTEISLAVNARRTSLLCSWNLEREKGKLGQDLL